MRTAHNYLHHLKQFQYTYAFKKTVVEFTKNFSLNGYKYLSKCKFFSFERIIWILVELFAGYLVVYLILNSWEALLRYPITTSLDNPNLPISQVPFPGVSVCGLNKISKWKATEFAKKLAAPSNISEETLLKYIRHLGNLYDFQYYSMKDKDYLTLQTVLDDYFKENSIPSQILKELTLNCSEFMSNCSWNGVQRECADLFIFGTTMEGYCCIFNYVPWTYRDLTAITKENKNKTLISEISGYDMGLSLVIHANSDDYFYSLILSEGANVHIFYSNDFPDTTSGGLIEKLIPLGSETFVRLEATTITTTKEVSRYPISKRKCLFNDEAQTSFGNYSYSDCILECKLKSILALCQCIPFQFARVFQISKHYPQCNLLDLICLDKYKEKWSHMYPFDYSGDEINRERQDSLMCQHCVPSCFGPIYKVNNDFAYIFNKAHKDKLLNYSILHIFFEKSTVFQYKQDVVLYWFEIISNFGGSCSLIVGISLISIFEFFYFFTIRLYYNIKITYNLRNN